MYDEDTQSSSDCFVESAQKIIDLLDDCINIDADPQVFLLILPNIRLISENRLHQNFNFHGTSSCSGILLQTVSWSSTVQKS